jgi:hypothetical protein
MDIVPPDWRTPQRWHRGPTSAISCAIFQAPNLKGHPMLNAGYHAVPPGMIATVVTSLEMLEASHLTAGGAGSELAS